MELCRVIRRGEGRARVKKEKKKRKRYNKEEERRRETRRDRVEGRQESMQPDEKAEFENSRRIAGYTRSWRSDPRI